ncbi:formyltetrahydrofolate-dependent phosphoribosylglycinamide formyltransferase [Solilutibacter tolerans]|uniref:Phosphoribosylglycinamide formyltransferase n=1 Tax=Solilutibacter tolerans TaxID=1604334 RepID=A0A1N6NK32_9GAMM|nr:formyltetrahydrofolate-dependent phosphoribosylglycinamide formyltransferase [Lysobacter tolerans]
MSGSELAETDAAKRRRLAVLVSGRGSNLQTILDAIAAGTLDAKIVGVFSDKPDCIALTRAPQHLRWSRAAKTYADRRTFDSELRDAVAASQPDWVVCAGYMRILGSNFVQRFADRLINIHPSLLPKYPGLHTHRRALEAGDSEHGASVHWVIPELDAGTVIAQARIPVLPGDDAQSLAARLLPAEHELLVSVLRDAVAGQLALPGPV